MEQGNMNRVLRRIAVIMGLFLLLVSIYWSQDGFNFEVAGDSGGTKPAVLIGYGLAIAVTVIQFVFSTNLKELNPSLVVFGLLAYAYSIYTNYQGILHFQGTNTNAIMAGVLGFAMDGVPEPLIAWGLKESLSGDFVGNLFKGIWMVFTGKPISQQQQSKQNGNGHNNNGHKPNFNGQKPQVRSEFQAKLQNKGLPQIHNLRELNRENRGNSDKLPR